MPPAVAIGGAALGSAALGAFSAHNASNQASRSRQLAQQQYQFAQGFRPDLARFSPQQQQQLFNAIFSAGQPNNKLEGRARGTLTKDFNTQLERQRQQVVESSARRGLFRSGIGAQQEAQFLAEGQDNLQQALLNQQLAFQQERARALAQAQNFMQNQQGQNLNLFGTMLGQANLGAQAAGQQTAAANQAWGQAIQGPLNTLANYGLYSGMGG